MSASSDATAPAQRPIPVEAKRPQLLPPVRIETAEIVAEKPERMGLVGLLFSGIHWLFGLASLLVGLAVLATIPILQFLSLGYLLEASGRVARSGRLRDGFPGVRQAARIGGIALGTWLALLPAMILSRVWYSSNLIDEQSPATGWLRTALVLLTILTVLHIVWAWFRGGKLRHFFWPAPVQFARRVAEGGIISSARDGLWDFVVSLRLPSLFKLGLQGFLGAFIWLFVPVLMLIGFARLPEGPAILLGLLGGLLFGAVLLYLPFLQTHFAAEKRFRAMFELRQVRQAFRRAPIAFWFALLIALAFALPLYLLKIEWTQRELAWLPSLVFVAFIYPARLLAGWAVGRARRREEPRHFLFRWLARFAALPVVGFYVFICYFLPYVLWHGGWSLFEQHAFLLPVPFFGL